MVNVCINVRIYQCMYTQVCIRTFTWRSRRRCLYVEIDLPGRFFCGEILQKMPPVPLDSIQTTTLASIQTTINILDAQSKYLREKKMQVLGVRIAVFWAYVLRVLAISRFTILRILPDSQYFGVRHPTYYYTRRYTRSLYFQYLSGFSTTYGYCK